MKAQSVPQDRVADAAWAEAYNARALSMTASEVCVCDPMPRVGFYLSCTCFAAPFGM